MFKKVIITVAIAITFYLGFNATSAYAAEDSEPNDSMTAAQKISIGENVTGEISYTDYNEDEDWFKFKVTEGNVYKITLNPFVDTSGKDFETTIVDLYKDSESADSYTLNNGEYSEKKELLIADYTGYYYIHIWNSTGVSYSFRIDDFSIKGKKVKDSEANTYKILSNGSAELTNWASKKSEYAYISDKVYFDSIDGMKFANWDSYTAKLTSIGDNACKGCSFTSIDIPKTVNHIGKGAFQNCKELGSEEYIMGLVISGKNVVIDKDAFKGCRSLGTIRVIKGASVKSVSNNAFSGTKKGIRIEVPKVSTYKKIFNKAGFKSPKYSKTYI